MGGFRPASRSPFGVEAAPEDFFFTVMFVCENWTTLGQVRAFFTEGFFCSSPFVQEP
jgi:hypothetical protein